LHGAKKEDARPVKESPVELKPAPEEVALAPEVALSRIKKTLNNFGLEDADIIDAVKAGEEYNEDMIKEGVAYEYILAYYDVMYNDEIADLSKHRYSVIYDLLRLSKYGFHQDWKFDDEDLLEVNLRPPLALFGVEVDFSPHTGIQNFNITIKEGETAFSAEYKHPGGWCDMPGKMNVVNVLLRNFGLHFIEMKTGGDHHDYFLVVIDRDNVLKKVYGPEYEKFITE